MADKPLLSDDAQKALKDFTEFCLPHHRDFITKVERRYKAFDAILDIGSDADKWTSKLAPPFVNHIAEQTLASLIDGVLRFKVKPRPRLWEPGEFDRLAKGAEAHEILHAAQMAEDKLDQKRRAFALQEAIAGLTIAKTFWRREKGGSPHLELKPSVIPGMPARMVEVQADPEEIVFDGPVTEVVDVRDFFWHEAATELQKSPIIAHRTWMTDVELQKEQKAGRFQNVDELINAKDGSADGTAEERELAKENRHRTRGMHEVLEIWWHKPDGCYVCVIGDRKVELRAPRPNPFWHYKYPFTACATRPNLFDFKGKSLVERIADLQEMRWDVGNQTTDNLRLATNMITALDMSIVDDIDAFEYEPGARWGFPGPVGDAVKTIVPDPTSAQVALPFLAQLESQMMSLAGGYSFGSSPDARTIGADTATEAALTQNVAQAATKAMRDQLNFAYQDIGQQRTDLNRQFMRQQIMVEQIGLDNEREEVEIGPLILQGHYLFDISPMQEDQMRSERQASANALMQMAIQLVGPVSMLAQSGAATPLNWDEFVRVWLEAYDDGDVERFFSAKQPPPQAAAPGPNGQQQLPAGPPGPGNVTAEPGSQVSQSPAALLQTIMAMRGGPNNTPRG